MGQGLEVNAIGLTGVGEPMVFHRSGDLYDPDLVARSATPSKFYPSRPGRRL